MKDSRTAAFRLDPKRIPLFRSCGIAHDPFSVGSPVACIGSFAGFIISNENAVVIWQGLIKQTFIDAVFDDFTIYSPAAQIAYHFKIRLALFRQEQLSFCTAVIPIENPGSFKLKIFGIVSQDIHRFYERKPFDFGQIIQR